MPQMAFVASLIFTCWVATVTGNHDDDVVQTAYGPVRGLLRESARIFLGVPYASPPVRWQPPAPPRPWVSIRDAVTDPPGCLQTCDEPPFVCPATVSEDCLYMNIWTPRNVSGDPHPVIVFIHGGRFADGFAGGVSEGLIYEGTNFVNGSQYNGSSIEPVVLVSINYRLGVPGFLFSSEGSIAGNYGHMDQVQALRFLQESIGAFGGDPTRVTLMGQSAGAISVAIHLTRPDGGAGVLFHRAILHSEPFSLPLRDKSSGRDLTQAFASYANCSTSRVGGVGAVGEDTWDEDCLRNLTSSALLEAQEYVEKDVRVDVKHPLQVFTPFTPTIGTKYLPTSPLLAFQNGQVADLPIMLGFTKNESVLFVFGFFKDPVSEGEWYVIVGVLFGVDCVEALAEEYLPGGFRQRDAYKVWATAHSATAAPRLNLRLPADIEQPCRGKLSHSSSVYPPAGTKTHTEAGQPQPTVTDTRSALSQLGTDGLFVCPIRNATLTAVNHRKQPLWMYRYDHLMSFSSAMWGANFTQCASWPCHGADLPQVFHPNQADKGTVYTPEEDVLSAQMQAYWASFAATGNPASGLASAPCAWPPVDATDKPVLILEVTNGASAGIRVEHNVSSTSCDFWDTRMGYSW